MTGEFRKIAYSRFGDSDDSEHSNTWLDTPLMKYEQAQLTQISFYLYINKFVPFLSWEKTARRHLPDGLRRSRPNTQNKRFLRHRT